MRVEKINNSNDHDLFQLLSKSVGRVRGRERERENERRSERERKRVRVRGREIRKNVTDKTNLY